MQWYCDRSLWNTISTEAYKFINMPRDLRESIAKLATYGSEGSEEESDDGDGSEDDI